MLILDTYDNVEDRVKNKVPRMATKFLPFSSVAINPEAQGKLTQKSRVGAGRNSDSSTLLYLSSFLATMKKIQ